MRKRYRILIFSVILLWPVFLSVDIGRIFKSLVTIKKTPLFSLLPSQASSSSSRSREAVVIPTDTATANTLTTTTTTVAASTAGAIAVATSNESVALATSSTFASAAVIAPSLMGATLLSVPISISAGAGFGGGSAPSMILVSDVGSGTSGVGGSTAAGRDFDDETCPLLSTSSADSVH